MTFALGGIWRKGSDISLMVCILIECFNLPITWKLTETRFSDLTCKAVIPGNCIEARWLKWKNVTSQFWQSHQFYFSQYSFYVASLAATQLLSTHKKVLCWQNLFSLTIQFFLILPTITWKKNKCWHSYSGINHFLVILHLLHHLFTKKKGNLIYFILLYFGPREPAVFFTETS